MISLTHGNGLLPPDSSTFISGIKEHDAEKLGNYRPLTGCLNGTPGWLIKINGWDIFFFLCFLDPISANDGRKEDPDYVSRVYERLYWSFTRPWSSRKYKEFFSSFSPVEIWFYRVISVPLIFSLFPRRHYRLDNSIVHINSATTSVRFSLFIRYYEF